jgi:hypothetical protein
VTFEPGTGHAAAEGSVNARKQWGVTEKDMPPKLILTLAQQIGFREREVYVRIFDPIKLPQRKAILDHLRTARRFLGWLPTIAYNNSHIVFLRK